eukprot:m.295363 g.295363  ORF g.295363 m.295363 type:complete len:361 (-) comp27176_c0_seq3:57-1139(-)
MTSTYLMGSIRSGSVGGDADRGECTQDEYNRRTPTEHSAALTEDANSSESSVWCEMYDLPPSPPPSPDSVIPSGNHDNLDDGGRPDPNWLLAAIFAATMPSSTRVDGGSSDELLFDGDMGFDFSSPFDIDSAIGDSDSDFDAVGPTHQHAESMPAPPELNPEQHVGVAERFDPSAVHNIGAQKSQIPVCRQGQGAAGKQPRRLQPNRAGEITIPELDEDGAGRALPGALAPAARQAPKRAAQRQSNSRSKASMAVTQPLPGLTKKGKPRERSAVKPLVVEIPEDYRGDGENGWNQEILDMKTTELNAFLKLADLTGNEIEMLKNLRRRIKNRVYTRNARVRNDTRVRAQSAGMVSEEESE